MPYNVNTHSRDNAAYDIAGSAFGDGGIFDFSDRAFVALNVESTSDAKGGNGGSKKPNGSIDSGSTVPTYTYISGPADGATGYNIEIQFMGDNWTSELMASFIASSDFLSAVISGDRPDYIADDDPNNFFSQDIDDILIVASLVDIDGAGGVLGRAGPTHIIYDPLTETDSDALPFAAIMEFDIADAETYLAAGTWGDIVFHEMMHTLGFGTLWERTGVVDLVIDDNGTKRPVDDTYIYDYTGQFAIDANDGVAPLVETDGGSGTAGGHWDETTYNNELMTGYINDVNYLDQMSLASLGDLGYVIDWMADEYIMLV